MIESLIVYINRDGKSGFLATSKKRGVIWVKKLHGLKSTRTFRGGFRGCQKTLPATSRMGICPYWYILWTVRRWSMTTWSSGDNWLRRKAHSTNFRNCQVIGGKFLGKCFFFRLVVLYLFCDTISYISFKGNHFGKGCFLSLLMP